MVFKSLKSRIIISMMGAVFFSLSITAFFAQEKAKKELYALIEENALTLLEAKKNHVESMHNSILYHKSAMLKRRKIELKDTVELGMAVIEKSWKDYKNGNISEATAKKRALNLVKELRYDNEVGYFWISDTKRPLPIVIAHPTMPELEGTVLDDPKYNCAMGRGENLSKAMVDVSLEHGEGFVDYLWEKPTESGLTEQQPKLSYVKLFKPWNWVVGTGVYIDDIEADGQERLKAVIEDLNKTITKQTIGESGYFFIFREDYYLLVHPNLSGQDISSRINPLTGNKLAEDFKRVASGPLKTLEYMWEKPGGEGEYRFRKRAYVEYYEPLKWYIASSVYTDELDVKISELTRTILLFSIFFLAVALIISLIVSRSITTPVNKLITAIKDTDEDGIPENKLPHTGTNEIEVFSSIINNMIDSISKSREELKQQRDYSVGIISESPYLICGLSPEGIVTFINPEAEKITGYTKEEIIGKNWWKTFYPDNYYQQVEILFEKLHEGEVNDFEMILTCKNGDRKNIVWNNLTKRGPTNEVVEIIGFGNDVTEKKKAETALIQSMDDLEEKERALKEAQRLAQVGNWSMDLETGEFYSSEEVLRIYGLPLETSGTLPVDVISKVVHPDDYPIIQKIIENIEKGAPAKDLTFRILRKDDETRWIYAAKPIVKVKDSKRILVGTIQDITERKKTEEELLKLRNYLRDILDSMPSKIIGVDKDGKVTQWNRTVELSTELSASEALGKKLNEVLPEFEAEMDNISESIKNCEVRTENKKPRFCQSGTCYEDITIYPLAAGGVEGAVLRIDDVTEKVLMEEVVVQSEKMLSVGGLAAGMAHEINNPLAGMVQNASVMKERLTNLENKSNIKAAEDVGLDPLSLKAFMENRGILRMIDAINESGGRVAAIVENMLSFARKSDTQLIPCDLRDLLDRTIELVSTDYDLKKQYDFKQIHIKKEYEKNIPLIKCERSKIQQVFLNILRNGSQAMQITGGKKPVFILRAYYEKKFQKVCIEIEDNGPGMDEATRKRIFEPFFTTKPEGIGTGLGLSVSYFIVTENHAGEMSVESVQGSGSKFIIRLPLEPLKSTNL